MLSGQTWVDYDIKIHKSIASPSTVLNMPLLAYAAP